MIVTVSLARLTLSDIEHLRRQCGLGAHHLDAELARKVVANLLAAVDAEEIRRLTLHAPYPHVIELPIDLDSEVSVGVALNSLLAVIVVYRDAAAIERPAVAQVWNELAMGVAGLRDEREQAAVEVAGILGRPSGV